MAHAAAPGWCAAVQGRRIEWPDVDSAITGTDPRDAIKDVVGAICGGSNDALAKMSELLAARTRWMTRLELTDADWLDAVDYATLGQGERMAGELALRAEGDGDPARRAWSTLDPIDQYALLTRAIGPSGSLSLDHAYVADALGGRLSELGRLGYVRDCLQPGRGPVEWAMCQGDIERLSLPRAAAELRQTRGYRGADKLRVRIAIAELRPALTAHADRVAKLIARDPAYARMFALGKAAREDWTARGRQSAGLLELVAAMDDARITDSRRAFAGCQDRAWAAWTAAIATIPAKAFEGMRDDRARGRLFLDQAMGPILGHAEAYLASVALVTCAAATRAPAALPDALIRQLGDAMARWPGFRGPRTATHTAILTAGLSLDDRAATVEYPPLDRPFGGLGGTTLGGGAGVIDKLTAGATTTTVAFKKQLVRQVQCADTVPTNRIVQVRSDGSFIYAIRCVRNETVVVDKADRPQQVNPRYLTGIKPGMQISITEDVAVAAWASPGAAVPSHVLGVAVK